MLQLDLLENGLDFIARGIDEVFDSKDHFSYVEPDKKSYRAYKYGCLHLFSGFLLLLKLRLERHHQFSIYVCSIRDAESKIKSGKFPNTIAFDEILNRLELGPRFKFSESEMKTIRTMQDFRNNFEHFKFEADPFQIWAVISKFLKIIDQFLSNELQIELENHKLFKKLHHKIENIESIRLRRFEKIKADWIKEMKRKSKYVERNINKIIDSLEVSPRDIQQGAEPHTFLECNDCCEEAVISSGKYSGICTNCFAFGQIAECERCHIPKVTNFKDQNDLEICSDCIEEIMAE